MKNFTRREFVKTGLAGVSAVSAGFAFSCAAAGVEKIDKVVLGDTGLEVSRLALGTGFHGGGRSSQLTRAGIDQFLKIARHAYERGITFLDTADSYGTHTFARELFKEIPREKFQVLTKIWTTDNDWNKVVPANETLDRFKKELGTDHFDIVLLHCMRNGNWITEKESLRDQLSEAKQKGEVKKIGVSCHNIDALRVAATDPWVDIILARINPQQLSMDGTPEEIMQILNTAKNNGKGIIGMKIYGAGKIKDVEHRRESLNFALKSENIHAITIGMDRIEHLDDTVDRIVAINNGLKG